MPHALDLARAPVALALGLVAAAGGGAAADPLSVSLGMTTRSLRTASAGALTGDSLDGGQLAVGRTLDVRLPGCATLDAEAGLGWGGASGTLFRTLATDVGALDVTAGARLRLPAWRGLSASARLDVGAARARVTLAEGAGASVRAITDEGWGARAAVALAGDLRLVRTPRLGLSLRLEAGYVEGTGIALAARREAAGGVAQPLAMTAASLGRLDLSGPTVALALVGRL